MMVCMIPYDRLPTHTEPTDLPDPTATTIAPKGREERKKERDLPKRLRRPKERID